MPRVIRIYKAGSKQMTVGDVNIIHHVGHDTHIFVFINVAVVEILVSCKEVYILRSLKELTFL